ncbi:acyltransferase family protein [Rhodococcus sp. HNM0569]|uniref:acyltransferase family protein n=1 Tax=Rhodococcus sp. HNM0569 TaxID=2716340 RepID=UPI003211D98A
MSASAYRYDLDGLRGIAIALVVVYHVWFGRVSGGVDIFLVLSGFFFTGMLVRRVGDDSGPSIRAVFTRTCRRLLPALVVVLLAVAAAIVLQRPYTQWQTFGDQLVASLLYFQNWRLAWTSADYAAADASVSPLQHLWSMSVQGQFYLAILLVIAAVAWACRRAGRIQLVRPALTGVIGVGLVASFLYALAATHIHQPWAYYDSGARLWELLAGALLALVVDRIALPLVWRRILAVAGFAVVVGCGIVLDGGALFPGPWALVPVGAALALIVAGAGSGPQPYVVALLGTRGFVELGSLAYALYLWHWPLLIFYLYQRGEASVGFGGGLAVILVSLVLAWLTQRLVERPFTTKTVPTTATRVLTRVWTPLLALGGVALVAAPVAWTQHLTHSERAKPDTLALDPASYPGAASLFDGLPTPDAPMRPTVLQAPHDIPQPTADGCITGMDDREVVECTYGDETAERTIAVVGGSHAEHWMPALDVIGKARGVRIATYLKMGCPITVEPEPLLGDVPNPVCGEWSADVLDRLRDDRPDWVFTNSTRPNPDGAGDVAPPGYVGVWERLADYGLPLLAMRDTPWLHDDGVPYSAVDCIAEGGDPEGCGMPRYDVLSPVDPTWEAAAHLPLVFPLDMSSAVCDDSVCRAVQGNVIVYHDSHHLAATYVRSTAPELDRQIGAATGWWS